MNIVDLAILKKMVAGGGGVSSVNVTGASGSHIESSGGPITDSGTIELNISTGYSIPSDDKQTAWDGKAVDIALSIDSSTYVVTAQLKDAGGALIGTAKTIDLPLESVVVSGTYDDQTKKVILTLQNGSTIEFSVADLVSGLQSELNANNKLNPDYIAYDASHRAVSDTEKDTWNAKQNAISDLETIRSGAAAGATAVQPATMSEALAAKQNSLNTAQLAAVNSGIDSDDVAQISTNQTNISLVQGATEELVNEGAKNLVNLNNLPVTEYGITVSSTSEGISVSGTNTQSVNIYIILGSISVEAGKTYALIDTGWLANNFIYVDTPDGFSAANPYLETTVKYLNCVTTGTYDITLRITANASVNNIYKPMICTKAKYDISPTYEPPAKPNYDLTRELAELNAHPFLTVPSNHNMIYRGQNLGDTLTADQDTALSSGNFTDLYLGDYWTKAVTIPAFYEVTTAEPANWSTNYTSYYTKSGDTYTPVSGDTAPTWAANTYYERLVSAQTVTLKAVIADFDTFYAGYASGYAAINSHHAAVIVTGFSNVVWNKTNTTAGGYVASLIHKWLVGSVLPQMETWFGAAKVLSHQKLLTNAITGDAASGWAWSSQKIALLSENQMYGSKVWGNSKASNGGYEPGEAFKHLNVFNHIDANLLFGNRNIWLRDIASALGAADLHDSGYASSIGASHTWVAPAALILLS